jgi:hypothetical protein
VRTDKKSNPALIGTSHGGLTSRVELVDYAEEHDLL